MAGNSTVAAMTAASVLDGTELLYSVQSSADRKATTLQMKTYSVGAGSVSVASGKTLTASNSLTLAGTDSTTMTFPSVSASIPGLAVANVFTAIQSQTGLTTTVPKWQVGLGGDTVYRAALGMDAVDVGAVSFGAGGASAFDLFLRRAGAANLRHGAADAASPVAQTFSVQNVVAGTSNTAGAALTIAGSQGTGTGVGGSIIFQTAAAGSTGSTQNALATMMTILSTGTVNIGGTIDLIGPAGYVRTSYFNPVVQLVLGSGELGRLSAPSTGVITLKNQADNDFGRLQFGGTTSSFPSLRRSSTVLQARLADDSDFAPLQGFLRTAANATTGLVAGVLAATTNASIVITDASGQAYRVPCII